MTVLLNVLEEGSLPAEGEICFAKPFDANRIARVIEEGRKLGHGHLATLRGVRSRRWILAARTDHRPRSTARTSNG